MPELVPAVPLTPGWHAARRAGVTATDIVTILGLSSWDSVYSLFWRKLGQVPDEPDNDRFRLGRELESYIAERWGEESGRAPYPGGLYRSHVRPWQLAMLDRKIGPLLPGNPIELKSWADADRHSWQDAPPARVRAQVLWQMDVMDAAVGHVGVVFLPSGEFRSYTIEHVPEKEHDWLGWAGCPVCVDQKLMREQGEEFMARLRLELPPPDPDSSAATLAAVRARFARQPDKQADVDEATWVTWETIKDQIKEHETVARALEIQLREQAGEASVLCVDGQPVARRIIVDAQDHLERIEHA